MTSPSLTPHVAAGLAADRRAAAARHRAVRAGAVPRLRGLLTRGAGRRAAAPRLHPRPGA